MEVKRIPPCPDYDIRGTEKWLEDMALKGFILCEGHAFQYGFAYFETGEPRRIRYRITPAKKVTGTIGSPNADLKPPDEETLEFHSQFGWAYTTYRGQFWIFRCEDPTAPEMNTDPQVQAIALKVAEKRLREHLLWLMVYGILMIAVRSDLFCTTLVKYGIVHYWTVPVFLILACIAWLPGIFHIIRFRRELKQGRFPEKTTCLSPAKAHAQFIARGLPLIWMIFGMWNVMQSPPRYGDTLTPELADSLPCVTVADLFPEAEVEYIDNNSYIFQWETDSASTVEFNENFRLTYPDGTEVTGFWSLSRSETVFDWIAGGVARETRFLDWLRRDNELLPLTLEDADWVKAYHVNSFRWRRIPHTILLLQKDNVFIQCTLHLYGDVPDGYTLEELGAFLVAHESDTKGETEP